jgi:predicted nucleotidyltransferase component of viral defense system
MNPVQFDRPGVWREIFAAALTLTDHLATVVQKPAWSFGGGTVLMLRLNHRHSKDIDLFVPDPQYLGHFSPRLTDAAERLTTEYQEAAEYIKLLLPTGEIDVVVGTPLTSSAWDLMDFQGRAIRVETCAEIVAKKMWHRGDQAKARDLFDLCAVADLEPLAIDAARPFMGRHSEAFLGRLKQYHELAKEEFGKIDRIAYTRSFEECMDLAEHVLKPTGRRR